MCVCVCVGGVGTSVCVYVCGRSSMGGVVACACVGRVGTNVTKYVCGVCVCGVCVCVESCWHKRWPILKDFLYFCCSESTALAGSNVEI